MKLLCPDLFGPALVVLPVFVKDKAAALNFLNCVNTITKNRGGADQTRTDDPLHAMQVLYQLSYNPTRVNIFYISSCQMSNIFANLLVIQGELYGLSNFKTGR